MGHVLPVTETGGLERPQGRFTILCTSPARQLGGAPGPAPSTWAPPQPLGPRSLHVGGEISCDSHSLPDAQLLRSSQAAEDRLPPICFSIPAGDTGSWVTGGPQRSWDLQTGAIPRPSPFLRQQQHLSASQNERPLGIRVASTRKLLLPCLV